MLRRAICQDTSSLLSHETDARGQAALKPLEVLEANRQIYEYAVLVTSLDRELITLASLYRDRADAQNMFDELNNHWGWGGFTTQDLARTRITARIAVLVYNWWALFVRLADSTMHREAITSRARLMSGVAGATQHAGRTTLSITSQHAHHTGIRQALSDVADFLQDLRQSSPQLTAIECWCRILARALSPL